MNFPAIGQCGLAGEPKGDLPLAKCLQIERPVLPKKQSHAPRCEVEFRVGSLELIGSLVRVDVGGNLDQTRSRELMTLNDRGGKV